MNMVCRSFPNLRLLKSFVAMALLAGTSPVLAQETQQPAWAAARFGDWVLLVSSDTSEAGTQDAVGRAFGVACGLEDCMHYIDLRQPCRNGATYPAVARIADQGFPLHLTCHHSSPGQQVLLNGLAEDYVKALAAGESVVLTVELDNGPQEATFSLIGCREAVMAAAEALGPGGQAI